MVYVYKKNKQTSETNELLQIKIRALWGFELQNTMISMIKSHLRSNDRVIRAVENCLML